MAVCRYCEARHVCLAAMRSVQAVADSALESLHRQHLLPCGTRLVYNGANLRAWPPYLSPWRECAPTRDFVGMYRTGNSPRPQLVCVFFLCSVCFFCHKTQSLGSRRKKAIPSPRRVGLPLQEHSSMHPPPVQLGKCTRTFLLGSARMDDLRNYDLGSKYVATSHRNAHAHAHLSCFAMG